MNHLCTCGHTAEDHNLSWGRCSGTSYDPDYGLWQCVCYAFDGDTDE